MKVSNLYTEVTDKMTKEPRREVLGNQMRVRVRGRPRGDDSLLGREAKW